MTQITALCLTIMVSCNVILTAVMTSRIIDRLKDLERRLDDGEKKTAEGNQG